MSLEKDDTTLICGVTAVRNFVAVDIAGPVRPKIAYNFNGTYCLSNVVLQ